MELMMKVIVVGDGKVTLVLFFRILNIDWQNLLDHKICQKCLPWRVQEDPGSRLSSEKAPNQRTEWRGWVLYLGHRRVGRIQFTHSPLLQGCLCLHNCFLNYRSGELQSCREVEGSRWGGVRDDSHDSRTDKNGLDRLCCGHRVGNGNSR